MTQPFPMLAAAADLKKIKYPVLGFPKIDGIRAVVHDGQALSRKLLPLPNKFIQGFFSNPEYQGLDGEIAVGEPYDPLCIKHTTSGVMSIEGAPRFAFYVFDKWDLSSAPFTERHRAAKAQVQGMDVGRVTLLQPDELRCEDDLLAYEAARLQDGFEGIILRDPAASYKHGRSTVREGGLLKLKRFADSEATVIGVIEEMHNGNDAQKDNLGRTKRSSAKGNKTGKGRAGALLVRDQLRGWEFEVGTGMDDEDKTQWWAWHQAGTAAGRIVKYKYFPIGIQDRPRHPVYLSWRSPIDI